MRSVFVETARIFMPVDGISNCSPLYKYAVYCFVVDKGIKLSSADEKEGIRIIMYRLVFRAIFSSQFARDISVNICTLSVPLSPEDQPCPTPNQLRGGHILHNSSRDSGPQGPSGDGSYRISAARIP